MLCGPGGGMPNWHLPPISIFSGISHLLGEIHCMLAHTLLSSTLSFLVTISYSNKWFSLLERRKECFEVTFQTNFRSVLYWNLAKPRLENLCEGWRVASERGSEVGKGSKALFRADVWRVFLVIPALIAVLRLWNPLLGAGSSSCSWSSLLALTWTEHCL